jgi:uncharacterized protein (TIGR02466 family)
MNIIQVFSTPLWEASLPDFDSHKEKFLETVKTFRANNPEGIKRSNLGGSYQSPMNLTNEDGLVPLFEFVCQMGLKAAFDLQFVNVDAYITAAWVNFNDSRSAINYDHVHQDTFSGVFYLQIPEKSGKLVMNNPGINPLWQGAMLTETKNKFNSDKIKIEPQEGHVFLWPSYLPHGVEPNDHDESRISISFNVICIPKDPIPHTK